MCSDVNIRPIQIHHGNFLVGYQLVTSLPIQEIFSMFYRQEMKLCHVTKKNVTVCIILYFDKIFILYSGKLHQTKILLNSPEIFTLCVGWDSVHSSPHEIQTFLEALPTEIKLDSCFRALAPQGTILEINVFRHEAYYVTIT